MKTQHKAALAFLFLVLVVAIVAMWTTPPPAQAQSTFAPFVCANSTPISQTANAQLITAGNSNEFIYICSMEYGTGGTAETGSVVEGTGTTCASNTTGVSGGATAATGGPIGSSPVQIGGGVGFILKTAKAGDNVCLYVSGTSQVGGYVTWAQQPF